MIKLSFLLITAATGAVVTHLKHPLERLITWDDIGQACQIRLDDQLRTGTFVPGTKQCFIRVNVPVTYEIDQGEPYHLPATSSEQTTVAVFGDIATTTSKPKKKHKALARPAAILPSLHQHVEEKAFEAVMYLGDIGYEFVKKNAKQFMTDMKPISSQMPFHTVLGNHEYTNFRKGALEQFYNRFIGQSIGLGVDSGSNSGGYFSLDIGQVHWIALDTEFCGEDDLEFNDANDSEAKDNQFHVYFDGSNYVADDASDRPFKTLARKVQREWLRRDLANVDRTRTPHVVVAGHRPPYDTETEAFYQDIGTLLDEFHVDLYVCGHGHSFYAFDSVQVETKDKTIQLPPFFIVGAAGNKKAPKYSKIIPSDFETEIRFKNKEFGYGLLHSNATTLTWEYGVIRDSKWTRIYSQRVK